MSRPTLSRHLIEAQREGRINADLRFLIEVVARACKAIAVSIGKRTIAVRFHVPVLPLAWDATLPPPHQNSYLEWALGKGFEVRAGTKRLPISTAEIVPSFSSSVIRTLPSSPSSRLHASSRPTQ